MVSAASKELTRIEERSEKMLVVSRRNGESVYVGDSIRITVVDIKGSRIRLGVQADADAFILRAEKINDDGAESKNLVARTKKAA